MKEIVEKLIAENRLKFLQIIRNLNARYEYSTVAQFLMREILPGIDAYEYTEQAKKDEKFLGTSNPVDKLYEVMEGTLVYQEKHKKRVQRHQRNSYLIDYIVSQMTLQSKEDLKLPEESKVLGEDRIGSKRERSASDVEKLINHKKSKRRKTSGL